MAWFPASNWVVKHVSLQIVAITLLVCASHAGSHGPEPQPSAADLMKDVVANELTDRTDHSNWMYLVTKVVEQQALTKLEVETKDGPVHQADLFRSNSRSIRVKGSRVRRIHSFRPPFPAGPV